MFTMEIILDTSIFDLLINEMSTFNRTGPMFDEVTIATVLKEVLRGLDFLHGKSKVHQEIKLENILLGKDGAVYLTDTGIRELIIQKQSGFGNYADFTVRFNEYNRTTYKWDEDYFDDTVSKFDTWCFGVIAIELVTEQTCTEKIPSLDDVKFRSFSKDFKEMISDCLQVEPDKRPTVHDLLQRQFFDQAKDKNHLVKTCLRNVSPFEQEIAVAMCNLDRYTKRNLIQAEAKQEVAKLKANEEEYKSKLAEAKQEVAKLKANEEEYKSKLAEAKQEVAKLKANEEEYKSKLAEAKQEVAKLKANEEEYKSKLAEANQEVAKLKANEEEYKSKLAEVKHLRAELEAKAEIYESDLAELEHTIMKKNEILADLEKQCFEVTRILETMKKKYHAALGCCGIAAVGGLILHQMLFMDVSALAYE